MDYAETIDYLLSFADFERSGRFADRPDVGPMLSLLSRLGDPHLGRTTIHIAGSKGKGSVAAMVESILRHAGLRTGLYTSPHLHSYCERIRIDGEPLSEGEFTRLVAILRPAVESTKRALAGRELVTFDLLTALAFLAFRQSGVQIQVVEVGLGGRLDSTNVFDSKEVCLITPISLEHTAILGDSVEAIAAEKAAIIRLGSPVVLAHQAYPQAAAVVREAAQQAGAPLIDVAKSYRWRRLSHDLDGQTFRLETPRGVLRLRLPLLGGHQLENAASAVAAVEALPPGRLPVTDAAIIEGLSAVRWPGRLEVLSRQPLVLADGAHNRDSARRLREALGEHFSDSRAFFIVGTSLDKDVAGLAEELAPVAAGIIATEARHPRAMPAGQVAAAFQARGCSVQAKTSVAEAIDAALAPGGGKALICLVGSLFLVAEGREHLLGVAATSA